MSDEEQLKLKGTICDSFIDRDLEVKVSLNQESDGSENVTNKEPTLVKLDQTGERRWRTNNIVFLYEDSNISFTLISEGPCGFGLKILTAEKKIVDRLYAGNEGSQERIKAEISRYQKEQRFIRGKDFNIDNLMIHKILGRSLVRIITWPIFGYDRGVYRYHSGIPPVKLSQKEGIYLNLNSSKDLKKYSKSQAVESPNFKENVYLPIGNVVENKDKSNSSVNGNVRMLFFTLKKDEKIEDVCELG